MCILRVPGGLDYTGIIGDPDDSELSVSGSSNIAFHRCDSSITNCSDQAMDSPLSESHFNLSTGQERPENHESILR